MLYELNRRLYSIRGFQGYYICKATQFQSLSSTRNGSNELSLCVNAKGESLEVPGFVISSVLERGLVGFAARLYFFAVLLAGRAGRAGRAGLDFTGDFGDCFCD